MLDNKVRIEHEEKNQLNYKKSAEQHNKLGLNSTLFLAYRDINILLEKYLSKSNQTIRFLDFGCGVGLSTKLYYEALKNLGYSIEVIGIDLSEENVKIAQQTLTTAKFLKIEKNEILKEIGKFDLIVCNFVLVENKEEELAKILSSLRNLLVPQGILIITNCNKKFYYKDNWYSANTNFPENRTFFLQNEKSKLLENQPVKVEIGNFSENKKSSFTFYDFFHSGEAYNRVYKEAGLALNERYKPKGKEADGFPWKEEMVSAPYKIDILKPL